MTVMIELSEEQAAALKAQAEAHAMTQWRAGYRTSQSSPCSPHPSLTCRRPIPRNGCGSSACGQRATTERRPCSQTKLSVERASIRTGSSACSSIPAFWPVPCRRITRFTSSRTVLSSASWSSNTGMKRWARLQRWAGLGAIADFPQPHVRLGLGLRHRARSAAAVFD